MAMFHSATSVAEHLAGLPASQARRRIGITGAPGAGKSTFAAELVSGLDSAVLLPMDGFHLPQAELRRLGRRARMGAPDTFDVDAFVVTLTAVHNSRETVFAAGFDREREEPVTDAIEITQQLCTTVVVEGNYLLLDSGGWERVAPLLDLVFFVELDDRIRLQRLIERHVRFGKTEGDANAWATGPDEANARIIAATARRADHRIRLN